MGAWYLDGASGRPHSGPIVDSQYETGDKAASVYNNSTTVAYEPGGGG